MNKISFAYKNATIFFGIFLIGFLLANCEVDDTKKIENDSVKPRILIDWNSFGMKSSEEVGIKLLEVIPETCKSEDLKNHLNQKYKSPFIKSFDYTAHKKTLYINYSIIASCTSNFVASIYTEDIDSNFLIIELFEYGYIHERCDRCFDLKFVIKVKKELDLSDFDIWPSLNGESFMDLKRKIKTL
ncbi:MAG: hypothetical protein DRJ10_10820 [Bacteroidetes bacterium]|nr:MAG: hypothetical protein DRJ10_10820 [Bacteroidota bacterium]